MPKIIKKFTVGEKLEKKSYFSAIDHHLLYNPDCAANYGEHRFSILARTCNELHTLESVFIQTLKLELCKQKKHVYKTKLFKKLKIKNGIQALNIVLWNKQ